jgi:hypothetical protein
MIRSRKFLTAGGVFVVAVLGWLTGVVLSAPPYIPGDRGATEMTQLKGDLTDYIADKFKKERVNGTLVDIAVQNPVNKENGGIEVPYILAYNEAVNGEDTTSWVQASVVLEKSNNLWRVVKVNTEKETVAYANAFVVKPAAGQ